MINIAKDAATIMRYIISCETDAHLKTVRRILYQFGHKYGFRSTYLKLIDLYHAKSTEVKLCNNK